MDKLEFYKKFGWKKITSDYGDRPNPFGKDGVEFHQGIDLVKESHGEVQAFTDGEVLWAALGVSGSGVGDYGNVVALLDAKGAVHVYAHLHAVKVHKGDKVKKGQVIGLQGTTGRSTGEHLHYEVRRKNGAGLGWTKDKKAGTYNPTDYLLSLDGKSAEAPKKEAAKPAPAKAEKTAAKPADKPATKEYKIKAGDTITSIAKEHGLTNDELLKLNPQVTNPSKIKAGAILNVK